MSSLCVSNNYIRESISSVDDELSGCELFLSTNIAAFGNKARGSSIKLEGLMRNTRVVVFARCATYPVQALALYRAARLQLATLLYIAFCVDQLVGQG